jgi:non-ribosomal peptide synthetase component E (peptide arylation enzyme)
VVGVQLPNSRLSCALDLAIAALGAVVLPYPVGRGDRDILSLLGRSRAVLAVTATHYGDFPCARRTLELADQLPALRAVVAVGQHGEEIPTGCVPMSLIMAADGGEFRPQWPDPDRAVRLVVSSGSEAEPKMVVYSHNALAGGRGRILADLRELDDDFRALFLVPLGTAFGSYGSPATLAGNGGTMLIQPRFDPVAVLRLIEHGRPTHLLGVPTMLRKILDQPELATTDLSSLRAVVLGGSTLDATMAARIRASMNCVVINLYGSADGVSSHTRLDDPPVRTTTAGRPDPTICEIRLVDEDLQPVPTGSIGEIIGLGPMNPMGYLAAPELNRRYRLPGGWVRSGDLARLDPDGYLTIVGRRKDVIIRGGANISPAEVEPLLLTHPAVIDVACVAVPDRAYGERMCCCVASARQLTLDELCEHLRLQGLEPRKFPEHLLLLPSLPIGAAGKVDRRVLQTMAEERPAST